MILPIVLVIAIIAYALLRLHQQRSLFKDLPGPPHHAIWGHFLVMRDIAGQLPPDAAPQLFANMMRRQYGLGDFFYLDLWPLAPPQLVIAHPDLASQVTQKMNLPKESHIMLKWTGNILGAKSMVSANGHDWLVARKCFVPGFQPRKLQRHIPSIVECALDFCAVMEGHAKERNKITMEDLCARMIFNIAAKVILGIDCDAQRDDDEFLTLFRTQASLAPSDFWSRYLYDISPRRNYLKYKNGRALDRYVGRLVDRKVVETTDEETKSDDDKDYSPTDYAIHANRKNINSQGVVEKETREMLMASVKTLIFAGHDTSASTLCYTYAALNNHPKVVKRLREEHDALFGKDPKNAADMLRAEPHLVSELPYTLAVIKEALRMWPPTGVSLRHGLEDYTIEQSGEEWPTAPFAVLVNNCATMRRSDIFKDPDRFYPERFLVRDENDPYFVPSNAFRAFEKGPRNCLGQTLALMQLKITLVMTVRRFEFVPAYDEGTYMYQTLDVTAKPSQGMPAYVNFVEQGL
ncbi:putative cytochrome P450 [Nemania abortiva]|nr:putative cytochrome P450 [Nemania abortiva]